MPSNARRRASRRSTESTKTESVQAIYDELPEIPCTGQCFESCSLIGVFGSERQYMRRNGVAPPEIEDMQCRHLDFSGRCLIHKHRPIVCRLYGVTEEMPCPFGCKPERTLTKEEGRAIMKRIRAIGPPEDPDQLLLAAMISKVVRGGP